MATLPLAVILALAHSIDPASGADTVAAVACQESGSTRCQAVNPFAIQDNCSKQSHFPATLPAAIQLAAELLKNCDSIDAGPMQVNSRNWTSTGLTVETAFAPRASVAAGLKVLHTAYDLCGGRDGMLLHEKANTLRCALSRYNTGKDGAVGRAYASSVFKLAAYVPSIRDLSDPSKQNAAPGSADKSPKGEVDAQPVASTGAGFTDAVLVHSSSDTSSTKEP